MDSKKIRQEFSYYMNSSEQKSKIQNNNNPLVSCLLSAIIPGTGQIYSGEYKRGAIYLSVELFSWLYRHNYNNKLMITSMYIKILRIIIGALING